MNLKKDISFGGKAAVYPTKTSINLIKADASAQNRTTTILLFVIFLVLLAIFTKFAVIDPITSGLQSGNRVNAAQAELDALKLKNASATELTDKYSHYIVSGLTEEEEALVDRAEVMDLLETKVMGAATISAIKVADNKVTVTCLGIGLQEASAIVQSIEQDERVSHVTVSTAQDREGNAATATIEITMKDAQELANSQAIAENLVSSSGTTGSSKEGGADGR